MTKKPKKAIAHTDEVVTTDEMFARAKRRDDLPRDTERLLPRRRGPSKKFTRDSDYVEWTKERFDRSIGFNELPEALRIKLSIVQKVSRGKRGPQRAPRGR